MFCALRIITGVLLNSNYTIWRNNDRHKRSIIIALIVSIFFLVFILGIFIGYLCNRSNTTTELNESKPKSFFDIKSREKKAIDIDDTKVVLNIDTNKLEKKFDKIADSKVVKSDIENSVNKLKNMKGK